MAEKPKPVDVHVGSRIRLRRTKLGMSQRKFGAAIGMTYQHVQQSERGTSRVGASRLFQLSKVLDVPVSFFFDDMPEEIAKPKGGRKTASKPIVGDPLNGPEILEFVRSYYRLPNTAVRQSVRELAKSLADNSD